MMADKRWSVEATKLFIREYKHHSMLYDVRQRDYKNRNKRLVTYRKIAGVLQANGHRYTVDDVKKKVNGLRSQFLAEKTKIAKSIRNGADGDDIYKPTVYWYKMLHFLDNSVAQDDSAFGLDDSSSQSVDQKLNIHQTNLSELDVSETILSTDVKQEDDANTERTSTSYDYFPSEASEAKTEISEDVQEKDVRQFDRCDPLDTFAKFVADELKGLRNASSDATVAQVKRRIQRVILDAWDAIDNLSD